MASTGGIKAGKAFILIEAVDKTAFVLRRIGSRMTAFGDKMMAMGRTMMTQGLLALTPQAASIKVFANFDQSMKILQARSRGTTEELAALERQAKQLGRTTVFTAAEVGDLMVILGRRGFQRSEILDMTPEILSLARAAGEGKNKAEDMQYAANLTAGAIRVWGHEAAQSGQIADVFTTAVNNSALTMATLQESMSFVAPIAKNADMSLRETVTTLGELSNMWIEASRGGTAMRRMIIELVKNVDDLTGKKINIMDAQGGLLSLPEVMKQINKATEGMGTVERLKVFEEIFGARAIAAGAGLADMAEQSNVLRQAMKNTDGATKKTASLMDTALMASLWRLLSAIQGIAIEIGEALAPALKEFEKRFMVIADGVSEWVKQNQHLIVQVTAITMGVIAAGAALMVLGLIVKTVGIAFMLAGLAVKIFAGIIALLTSPLGLVLAAVSAIAFAAYHMSDTFRNNVNGALNFVIERFQRMGAAVQKAWGGVAKALAMGDIETAWKIGVMGLRLVWLEFLDMILVPWNAFIGTMEDLWNGFMSYMGLRGSQELETFTQKWLDTQRKIANWLLTKSADEDSMFHGVATAILGVDMAEEVKRGKRLDEQIAAMNDEALLGPESDALQDAINQVNKKYDKMIADARDSRARSARERRAEIDRLNEELDREIEILRQKQQQKEKEEKQKRQRSIDEQSGRAGQRPPSATKVVSPELHKGLEKGTVAAAQQFQRNMYNQRNLENIAQDQLTVQEDIRDAVQQNNQEPVEAL